MKRTTPTTNSPVGRGLYRSRRGILLGVCRGVAEYVDLSVFWVRVIAVIALFATGLWPLSGVYLVAALLMKPEPAIPFESEREREFYTTHAGRRLEAVRAARTAFERLERRLCRMEDIVTGPAYRWRERLDDPS
jgi:phage shock protein C